jgi:tRNA pseudouridine32 synthase/23S rRNA pseudouridine746 synthase
VNAHFELHLPVGEAATPVDLLAARCDLSRGALKQAMNKGAVWLTRGKTTRRLRRVSASLRAGDELHLYYDAAILAEEPPEPSLVADEGDYSVWVKPCGMRSQGSKWGDHCTIGRWSERRLQPQRPAFVVHRLDRATRGLILVAHGKEAAGELSRLFRERQVEKRYRAWVRGAFPNAPQTYDDALDGKPARSTARCLRRDETRDRSLLEISIETGRKHQIRRHLSQAGYPVVGDRLHGGGDDEADLQLASVLLAFACPLSGEPRRYVWEEPDW